MTLDNLVAIGRLIPIKPDRDAIERLLLAAARNLKDAAATDIGPDTRFDVAYKAILKCAMAALAKCGYRTSQNQPGHHQTAIQCLTRTIGAPSDIVIRLEVFRQKRNLSDYSGDPIPEITASECVRTATALLATTRRWMEASHAGGRSEQG